MTESIQIRVTEGRFSREEGEDDGVQDVDDVWWEEAAKRVGRIVAVEQISAVNPRSRVAVCLCPLPTTKRAWTRH